MTSNACCPKRFITAKTEKREKPQKQTVTAADVIVVEAVRAFFRVVLLL